MDWGEIKGLYSKIDTYSHRHDWNGLENFFHGFAENYSGLDLANQIRAVKLDQYIKALSSFLDYECKRLSHHAVKAIYFEYELAKWASTLFICDRYNSSSAGSEEWASHWIDRASGPCLPKFADIYQQYGGFQIGTPSQIGVTFYLIARTTAAFGIAVFPVPIHKMKVGIGHQAQEKITRIYE